MTWSPDDNLDRDQQLVEAHNHHDVDRGPAGDWTVARGVIRSTHEGPWAGADPTGRRFEIDVCALVHWDDGHVVEEHLYYDQATILADDFVSRACAEPSVR